MIAVCLQVLLFGSLLGEGPAPAGASFLYAPAYCLDDVRIGSPRPYLPQPGDIILSTDHSFIIRAGHYLTGAGGVHHSALVIARPDGSMAVLEAGPFNGFFVEIRDWLPLLLKHEERCERVWVRQRKVPLTPEQSAKLTAWAMAQNGKLFAGMRMLGQFTVFRSRGPIRTFFVGGPHGERNSYFCSELVMESCVAAGLVDPAKTRPAATYPSDLFMDRSSNLFLNRNLNLSPCWFAPARWASCP